MANAQYFANVKARVEEIFKESGELQKGVIISLSRDDILIVLIDSKTH